MTKSSSKKKALCLGEQKAFFGGGRLEHLPPPSQKFYPPDSPASRIKNHAMNYRVWGELSAKGGSAQADHTHSASFPQKNNRQPMPAGGEDKTLCVN